MKTVEEIREEVARLEDVEENEIPDNFKDILNSRLWTLKWVLGEED